jgi:hypothetical protein
MSSNLVRLAGSFASDDGQINSILEIAYTDEEIHE